MEETTQENKESILELMSHPEDIKFAYQPIFDVETGNIFGYEALMRPFPYTPMEVITEYSKLDRLNEIEEFTFYYAAKYFLEIGLEGKLFINSFPAAFISTEGMERIHECVQHRLIRRLVVEILEYTEFSKFAHIQKRVQFTKSRTNELIAIDDYGTGKNIDTNCIDFYNPNIVKIDRQIISNIQSNTTNQKKLLDICDYMQKRNIEVLAEGVETREEYEYLKKYPISLMQGFYLGKPKIYN